MKTVGTQRPTNGREIARDAVRASLSNAARVLFETNGIDATSVEAIAEAAGVSSRTFYRHFESKEDLALAWLDDPGPAFRQSLRDRPADEPIWVALRHAFDPMLAPDGLVAEQMLLAGRMADSSPGLMARIHDRFFEWEALMADVVVERLPEGSRRDAELLSVWALGTLRVSFESWRSTTDRSLPALESILDEAFNTVTRLHSPQRV